MKGKMKVKMGIDLLMTILLLLLMAYQVTGESIKMEKVQRLQN